MKLIVCLSGLVLYFLIHHWKESVEEQKANLTTLAQIIDFFEQNYMENPADPKPYAVAINVPRNQCQGNFDPSNFLTQENTTCDVKNAIYYSDNHFYWGKKELMAAGPRPLKETEDCKSKPVSDLLQNSSFTQLLERRNDGCVVIYTVYSPCQNMSGSYNIIPALETLKNHSGIKAFVFKNVYGTDLSQNCAEIMKRVPLYRYETHVTTP